MRKLSTFTLGLLLYTLWLVSCSPAFEDGYPQPVWSGWETTQPDEVGIDEEIIVDLVERVSSGDYQNIHSILIVKDDRLVFEQYFPGYTWDWDDDQFQGEFTEFDAKTLHSVMSVSKVFTSALVGIALESGFIEDLDQPVISYFPNYSHLSNSQKNEITLEHLLTMTSGLEWNSIEIPISTRDARSDVYQMHSSDDPVAYVLAKPLLSEPGSKWYNSDGDVTLLGEVIREATSLRIDQFAEENLFTPLEITDYRWRTIGDTDVIAAGGGLELRPRDMAKLGLLYLNDGVWNGEQIIPAEWIRRSTSNQVQVPLDRLGELFGEGYGYYWWLPVFHTEAGDYAAYTAAGWGGQRIFVFPDLNMVVVLAGGNYLNQDPTQEIIEEYILPAVEQNQIPVD